MTNKQTAVALALEALENSNNILCEAGGEQIEMAQDQVACNDKAIAALSEMDRVQAVPDVVRHALSEIEGCFEAAYIEGLEEALSETTDGRLKDLVERRLLWAKHHAETLRITLDARVAVDQQPPAGAVQEQLGKTCADGGTCHHFCETECFRKSCCGPLAISGLNDDWTSPQPAIKEVVKPITYTREQVQAWRDDIANAAAEIADCYGANEYMICDIRALSRSQPASEVTQKPFGYVYKWVKGLITFEDSKPDPRKTACRSVTEVFTRPQPASEVKQPSPSDAPDNS